MPSPLFDGMGDTLLGLHKNGAQATFTPQVGTPLQLDVIFNDRYQKILVGNAGAGYGAPTPTAWIKVDAIAPVVPAFGDVLTINSIDYVIRGIEFDGLEMYELPLSAP